MPEIRYNEDGTVHRVYTEEWANNSVINYDKLPNVIEYIIEGKDIGRLIINTDMLPQLVKSLVAQRKEMISYIQKLQDEIDKLKTLTTK